MKICGRKAKSEMLADHTSNPNTLAGGFAPATSSLPIRPGAERRSGLTPWQCRRVCAYVSANIANPIRVSDLATEAGISVGHFARGFMITFGTSPSSFIRAERIAKAKDIMSSSSRPLSFVAKQCGLADHAHFCRLFRRFEGVSPSAWRQRELREVGTARLNF
ncbi:helix-turn-helix domain-containing protein [Endobacterium cereale]|uniref:helix-turn-helix domain-containing protein n=1 Tax=Endobacterium cereale TaxID=2663029 RepID=UPI00397A1E36